MLNKIIKNVPWAYCSLPNSTALLKRGVLMPFVSTSDVWYSSSYGNGFGYKIYNADPGGKTLLNFASRYNNANWVDRLTITSNGRIGINTDNPVSTLGVRGSFRIANHPSPEKVYGLSG